MKNPKNYNITKGILLNVPLTLIQQIDHAAEALDLTRTALIIRCVEREISTVVQREVIKACRGSGCS